MGELILVGITGDETYESCVVFAFKIEPAEFADRLDMESLD